MRGSSYCYAHFDIEADGPSPYLNNMISIGISFTDQDGKEFDSFLGDFKCLKNHKPDQKTMDEFWSKNEKEYKRIQNNAKSPQEVMMALDKKLLSLNYPKIIWVAAPAAFDWQWLNYYYEMFKEHMKYKLPFMAMCMSSMREVFKNIYNLEWKEMCAKCEEWVGDIIKTHCPLDDARFQARVFHVLLKEFNKLKK